MNNDHAFKDPGRKQLYAFQSDLQSISRLEMLLDELKERFALHEEVFRSIWISVNEAISNAIVHGNKCDPYKKVLLWVEMQRNDIISFRVRDEGSGFDPAALPDPTAPDRILEPNGRGVFLIRNLADHVEYSANGAEVEMGFSLAER